MKVPCVLVVLIGCAVIENVHCQLPEMPMPPMPPMPGLFESRVRRSAQAPPAPPAPPANFENDERVRRSAQAPPSEPPSDQPPNKFSEINERVRRSAQAPPAPPAPPAMPAPPAGFATEERQRRSYTIASDLKQMNVGEIASSFYGYRNKREARGGRMPTTNG